MTNEVRSTLGESQDVPTIRPEGIYTAPEVARHLKLLKRNGQPNTKSIYLIPEKLLPKLRVGPRGGAVRYLGRDVLNYQEEVRKAG